MQRRLPNAFYNPITLVGLVIAVFNTAFIVFLLVVEAFSSRAYPYADIVIWMILPALIFLGVVLIVVGIRRERRKQREGQAADRRLPVIDFNNPTHRTTMVVLASGFLLLSLLYAFAGYKAVEFAESTTFCGTMCHRSMGPEFRAHSSSAHAEVACADCHVGPGAKYFILTKLRGTRELINEVLDRYHKPIPTPIANLRPSEAVCENCHGPKLQINQRLESRTYYLSDEKNTRKTINLLLRMGAIDPAAKRPSKIHWHSSTTQEIEYAASDEKRAVIPWIRVKRLDGKERVYRAAGSEMTDAQAAASGLRRMDCIDCHNRAGHPFNPSGVIVNSLMTLKLVDPDLPGIKQAAVQALDAEYQSREDGVKGIASSIKDFYKTNPAVSSGKDTSINAAIEALQRLYARNYDPNMKVSWRNFPDNRGHRSSAGCFRCHDDKHRSADGAVLSRDCGLCHLLIERVGDAGAKADPVTFDVMKYPHPVNIGDAWKDSQCHDCHG